MRSLGRADPSDENANVTNSTKISRPGICMGAGYQDHWAKCHRFVNQSRTAQRMLQRTLLPPEHDHGRAAQPFAAAKRTLLSFGPLPIRYGIRRPTASYRALGGEPRGCIAAKDGGQLDGRA
jgi:hypothetical protein